MLWTHIDRRFSKYSALVNDSVITHIAVKDSYSGSCLRWNVERIVIAGL